MSDPDTLPEARSLRGRWPGLVWAIPLAALLVVGYLGVRGLLDGDANFIFFAAIIYAAAVSVGIYVFWSYMMRFLPLMRTMTQRLLMVGVMGLGWVGVNTCPRVLGR